MHVVTVSDPYFGGWLRCGFGGGWPLFFIGPLFSRVFRMESIWTTGRVVTYRGVREKDCHHTYVEGSVTGQPDGSTDANVFSTLGGSKTITVSQFSGKILNVYKINITGGNKGNGSATFHCRCDYDYIYKGVLQYSREGGFDIRLRVLVDTFTGNVTYDRPVLQGAWGYCQNSAYVTASASPYGSGAGDVFSSGMNLIKSYIEMALREAGQVGDLRAVRDEAFLSAVDGIEIGQLNLLNDLTDALAPLATIRQLGDTFRGMKNWKGVVKGIASLHLFWDYCVQTNIMTRDQVSRISQFLASRGGPIHNLLPQDLMGWGRAQRTIGSTTILDTAKVVFGSGWGPFSVLAQLKMQGLLPTAEDAWDLVPYSFVLDWCLPISSTIGRLEKLASMMQLPLYYWVHGRKAITQVDKTFTLGGHSFTINVKHVDYRRTVSHTIPRDLGLGSFAFSDPRKHGLNAGSLVLQRLLVPDKDSIIKGAAGAAHAVPGFPAL